MRLRALSDEHIDNHVHFETLMLDAITGKAYLISRQSN